MEKTTSSIHPICIRLPLHLVTQPWVLLFECLLCLCIFLLCFVLPIKQRNGQTRQSAMKTLNFNVDLIKEKGISACNELKTATAYFISWTWPPLLCLGPPTSPTFIARMCGTCVSVVRSASCFSLLFPYFWSAPELLFSGIIRQIPREWNVFLLSWPGWKCLILTSSWVIFNYSYCFSFCFVFFFFFSVEMFTLSIITPLTGSTSPTKHL